MNDQLPDRPRRPARGETSAGGPRKLNRGGLIVAGTVAVAAAVSAGLVLAGGHNSSASPSGEVTAQANALATATATASDPPSAAPAAHSPSSAAASARSQAAASASPPWASTSCPSQLATWRGTGAGGQLQVVATGITIAAQPAASLHTDLANTAPSAPPGTVTGLSSAAASLRSSTQAAGKSLIPACVPGARKAEVTGLADLGRAVTGFGSAVSEARGADYAAAAGTLAAAIAAMQSGSAQMATAIADLNRYGTK